MLDAYILSPTVFGGRKKSFAFITVGGFGICYRHGDSAVMDVPFLVKTFYVIASRVVNLFARYYSHYIGIHQYY